jgi:hypothetical protein
MSQLLQRIQVDSPEGDSPHVDGPTEPLHHPLSDQSMSAPVESNIRSIANSKELQQRCLLPSEVWATIFDYTGYKAGPLQPEQISRFRLLSRSITAGLDEWMRLEPEEGVKRDGSLRLGRAYLARLVSPVAAAQIQLLGLLAVSRAPEEFLLAVTKLGDDFLSSKRRYFRLTSSEMPLSSTETVAEQAVSSVLSQLPNVTCIGAHFLSWGGRFRVVDLNSMTQLTAIGYGFLQDSVLDELVLPRSLKHVGNCFLDSAIIQKINLSQTCLEAVGDYFLRRVRIDEPLLFPSSLKSIGTHFLAYSIVKKVDLSQTSLEAVGHCFFYSANSNDELLLPPSLKSFGTSFLESCTLKKVDLSKTRLDASDEFLQPRRLGCIGCGFLWDADISHVLLPWSFCDFIPSCYSYRERWGKPSRRPDVIEFIRSVETVTAISSPTVNDPPQSSFPERYPILEATPDVPSRDVKAAKMELNIKRKQQGKIEQPEKRKKGPVRPPWR